MNFLDYGKLSSEMVIHSKEGVGKIIGFENNSIIITFNGHLKSFSTSSDIDEVNDFDLVLLNGTLKFSNNQIQKLINKEILLKNKEADAFFNNELAKLKIKGSEYADRFVKQTHYLNYGMYINNCVDVISEIISKLSNIEEVVQFVNLPTALNIYKPELISFLQSSMLVKSNLPLNIFDDKLKDCVETINDHNITKNELEKRGFVGFLREERFDNLTKILNDGNIFARDMNKSFNSIADENVLKITDDHIKKYVRFYFYKKTPTYYRFENDPENKDKLAYLVFDWNLVYSNLFSDFYDGNAASKKSHHQIACDFLTSKSCKLNIDWDEVFARGPIDWVISSSGEPLTDPEVLRKRNAEFLVFEKVNIKKYLRKIIFKNQEQMNAFFKDTIKDKTYYQSLSVIDGSYFYN